MDCLILIGPRGSGKSSIGKELSSILGVQYLDADELFQVHTKRTIAEFVKNNEDGWEDFRKVESSLLLAASIIYSKDKIVLSSGGGAVAHPEQNNLCVAQNTHYLKRMGKLIYLLPYEDLERSSKVLSQRVNLDPSSALTRPTLNGCPNTPSDIFKMLKSRDELYKSAADKIIYTAEMTPTQVARMLVSK